MSSSAAGPVSYDSIPSSPPAPSSRRRGTRPSSGSLRSLVDLGNVQEGWARWKGRLGRDRRVGKSRSGGTKPKELMRSVFGKGGSAAAPPLIPGAQRQTSDVEFEAVVSSVKRAIERGVQPKLIAKGSSGSYFARDEGGHVRAVFKPADEEPYSVLNPKWTKWFHRTFFFWVGFGRACLIPNLSYISEAASSHLDKRLGLGIVPPTELESLSSPAFFYDWLDRTAHATKGHPLPDKIGSFQLFMRGFTDATQWLKEHPWPSGVAVDESSEAKSSRHHLRRCLRVAVGVCGRADADALDDDEATLAGDVDREAGRFRWTHELKDEFCEELQKLVALDFLMLNTDRGLDNFMIRYKSPAAALSAPKVIDHPPSSMALPMASKPSKITFEDRQARVQIAAIDNSLSFPWEHPAGWRSYPYGWLFLPVSLIGRPFGDTIRQHLIPLLSSPAWWEKTIADLRKLMTLDAGFNENMFKRQMAVMKGQGYNLLASLRAPDEGPLELCRRSKVEIWTDEIQVSDDAETDRLISETLGRPLSNPPAIDVPPAPTLTAQNVAGSGPPHPEPADADDSFLSSARARPQSASPESNWKTFEGVSGASVMKLLDKESRRRGEGRKNARSRSAYNTLLPETEDDGADSRDVSSDGEDERGNRGLGRPRAQRSHSTGPDDLREDAASLDGLSQSIMSAGADFSASDIRPRPPDPSARWQSYRSDANQGSTEWLLGAEDGDASAEPKTRTVLVERVREVHGRAFFDW